MRLPHTIGRYRVEKPLGSGAFGVVWLAHDDSLDARVAIKVMADNWAQRLDLRERFLSEARMLRQAASPRVVQVHDIGELPDERPYFVMEYADGGTLEDRLADGPLPVPEALRLAAEAARAVAVLHGAGILHRDIKPSNLLLRSDPGARDPREHRVLIADLGLAKTLAHASGLTMTAGSAGYMSPEQSDPGPDGIDERADVYGLGALTYHLVTGEIPAAPGRTTPPTALRPDLPPRVAAAITRALHPDRTHRWPTALTFAEELTTLSDPTTSPATAAGSAAPASAGTAADGSAALVSAGTATARPARVAPPSTPLTPTHPRRGRRLLAAGAVVAAVLASAAGWLALDTAGDSSTAMPETGFNAAASGTALPAPYTSPSPSPTTSASPLRSSSGSDRAVPPVAATTKSTKPTATDRTSVEHTASAEASVSAPAEWTTVCVQPDEKIKAGESWRTNRTRMAMETGGNLVIYDENGKARWSSGTTGSDNGAYLQGDGNLVVYSPDGKPLWNTGTQGNPGTILCLGADGNVNLIYQDQAIWSANTGH
ncbi:protein kinase domain-containing protein [Streptomyces sp. NPDC002920]